jgi:putative inorganic carbon (hco3(-)) transporter
MNGLWQQLTLSQLPLHQWQGASYLSRLSGALQRWQYGSWIMGRSNAIALWFMTLFFGLAPFVSTNLMSVLLVGCGLFWGILTLSDQRQEQRSGLTPIHLVVILYWGLSVIATGLSPVKIAALEGLVKLTLYLVMFLFMARAFQSEKVRSWMIGIYLHVALLVSCYGIRQWIFGAEPLATWSDPTSEMGNFTRVYSFLGNPNLLAGYLIPAIAFSIMAVFAWKNRTAKLLASLMALANTACLVFTFSRGGWIALVVIAIMSALLLGYWFNLYKRKWVLPAALGGMVGFILLSMVLVPAVRMRVLSIFIGRGDSSNNFRINVWTSVLQMIKARPVLGIGPGNDAFNLVYPAYSRASFTALGAYSVPLEIAVETGLLGLSCFVWLLTVTFNQAAIQLGRLRSMGDAQGFWLMGAIAGMAAMMVMSLTDTVWYRPQVNTLWWMMVAVVASFYQPFQSKES